MSNAGSGLTSGSQNILLGRGTGGIITTGNYNTAVGSLEGTLFHTLATLTTGSNCSVLGAGADVSTAAALFRTSIGSLAVNNNDNSIQLGRTGTDTVNCGSTLSVDAITITDTKGHPIYGAGTPSITPSTGAGTSPTISISGSDCGGKISLTPGTSPSGSGVIATITFAQAWASAPSVVLTPGNASTASIALTQVCQCSNI